MPEMDGYTATRQIKKIFPNLTIIAQTAYAMTGNNQIALENGCDAYIAKPIMPEVLIKIFDKYI